MTPETTAWYVQHDRPNKTDTPVLAPYALGQTEAPVGFTTGAKIVTTRGARSVEDIRPGDHIITRSSGIVPVQHVEQQSVLTRAIYVIAGSIGHHQLTRDTMLPAGQAVLVRDWRARALGGHREIIAPASALADGEFVRDIGFQLMTLHRLYCGAPQVIYADGMELLSAAPAIEVHTA